MIQTFRLIGACSFVWAMTLPVGSAEFKLQTHTFTVPDGFEVELVAGPPLVDRPITADFDEQGRLYVTDSSGTNDKVEKQLADKPHRVVRLEDTDGDGRFDKSTVFADKMMFPEGCLWFRGSLYVSAPPSIWKLTDTDGDGVADKREEWLPAQTLTGCANDLHGPQLGPDGWIYWCKGAFAKQTYERPGRPAFVTRAAHIFRARPDGSGIEPVLTGGMDNPVSVAFTPGGERILTGTFFVHPGGGQRDGLIHAIYGGVYGKDHDVIYDHKRTGDLMPIMTHHGPAASCFVLRYESTAFGPEFRDNIFACLFNLQKVMRHVLVPEGATYHTIDEEFLKSDNPDFHPTALVEDADGSLLVVDTGGWYKICCPTSQLWKPDVLGSIYRVRRTGAPQVPDPRGARLAWNTLNAAGLVQLLGDPRLAIRQRAIDSLGRMEAKAVPELERCLKTSPDAAVRRNAVWALTRMESGQAREAIRSALHDRDETVRQAAVHAISVWRDGVAVPELVELLEHGGPQLQRVAAEALGRIGNRSAVPALLRSASTGHDRVGEHSLIYALIEIADPAAVRQVLGQPGASGHVRRAALIALDQMDGGGLTPEVISPLLGSSEPILKSTASWILGHHPEWAGALVGYFRDRLSASNLTDEDRANLEQQLSGFARDGAIQELLTQFVSGSAVSKTSRLTALRVMARSNLKEAPSRWAEAVAGILAGDDAGLVAAAVSTTRTLSWGKTNPARLNEALRGIGRDLHRPAEVRLDALSALPAGLSQPDEETFEFLRANVDPAKPVLIRGAAAGVLAKSRLSLEQLTRLTDTLKAAGPLEVSKILSAFEKSNDEALGLKLISALKESPGLAGLRPDQLRPALTNFPASVQQEGEVLVASLNVDADKQKAHLDELLSSLHGGDIRRGQSVFNSQKAACSTCHAIGYLGGSIGPDLTRIGQIRTDRDLLEAIAYPSASFVRSYEPVLISTKSGDDYGGVVRQDSPDQVVLATGPGAEVRLARSEIAEIRPSTVSVMPGGLEEQLSREELADLIAFLKATRW